MHFDEIQSALKYLRKKNRIKFVYPLKFGPDGSALNVGLRRRLGLLLPLCRTVQLRRAATPYRGLCCCRELVGESEKAEFFFQTSHAYSLFSTNFPVVRSFADWVAPSPLSQNNSPPPFKFYSPIHKLIMLMPG